MSRLSQQLGKRIRDLRKTKSLTQARLAERANLSEACIGTIERGHRTPRLPTLQKIASALKVEVRDLFDFRPEDISTSEEALKELYRNVEGKSRKEILKVAEIAKIIYGSR
ncbi:MAG: helix-turn-helix transcriptional regulator [Nitrospirae bacterium]|nr:helix-turn-helix transcriptional regulator [Nitrospirota bacterium]